MEAHAETMTTAVGIDPVCGMTVADHKAAARWRHGGRSYLFCSAHCLTKFKADPARYAGPPQTAADAAGVAAKQIVSLRDRAEGVDRQ